MGETVDATVLVIEEALGQRVECLGSFKARGPDQTRVAGGPGLIWWIARYLWRRPRRRLPSPVHLVAAADGRLYAVQMQWAPLRVRRVVGSWQLSDVHVKRRTDWQVGGGVDAVDLILPDETVPLRAVDVRDDGTRRLLDRVTTAD